MANYYTGRGDSGDTGVLASSRLLKDDALIHAIGDVDELNSQLGVALFYTHDELVRRNLRLIQNDLFILGANLASIQEKKIDEAHIKKELLERLEKELDVMGKALPELKQFVLPGGGEASVQLHVARSIARRAERSIVAASKRYSIDRNVLAYMNRLSSFLFVAALYLNFREGIEESHPTY